MTNQEILTKAIEKVIAGGCNIKLPEMMVIEYESGGKLMIDDGEYSHEVEALAALFIFNHDFAKALWGEDDFQWTIPAWQYHLQQMVIADDPIKYLGEHI